MLSCCRSCGSEDLADFFDLGEQPLANSLLDAAGQPEKAYPLALTFCRTCSLVQLTYTADPKELFSHYVWVTGTSSTARAQAEVFCDETLLAFGATKPRLVVELASNDGTFLRPFQTRGVPVLGIDPAANVAADANASGVPTLCAFFDEDTATKVVAEHGTADLVTCRNVLPHVAALHSFVSGIKVLIGETGLAAVEFHYGLKINEGLQYDSIYHEHLCYFTLTSVRHLFRSAGLEVVDVAEGPIGGGALVVYCRRPGSAVSRTVEQYIAQERDAGVDGLPSWQAFGEKSRAHRDALKAMLAEEARAGRKTIGYGASARSSTMLNFCDIGKSDIAWIADANPRKQNRFTAGTRIPIKAPETIGEDAPDTVVLLAWNFADELTAILRDRFGFKGRIVRPLPVAPVMDTVT